MNVRTWPALDVGRLKPAPANSPDLLQAALVDYRISAIEETTPDLWRVFFSASAERDKAAGNLARQFPDLSIKPLDVADGDWVAKSQASLRSVRIGNIIVAPPWGIPHTGRLTLDLASEFGGSGLTRPVVIAIKPSMGFGTAHHATTRLCLAALQRLSVQGRSALDVGTGSSVLAIAASRLGATPVVGIDDDPNALHAAEENLTLNRAAEVTLREADLRSTEPFGSAQGRRADSAQGMPERFDLVIANLTGALLVGAAGRLRDLTAPGGRLILSGFMRHEEAAVLAAYSDLAVSNRSEEQEWVSVSLERR
ncbi:MAG: methyltransferase domain-containing protein [Acidobacteria bacterium]|nr:methyltransferase domain-containing protein [Acidobacteriota bacterium]